MHFYSPNLTYVSKASKPRKVPRTYARVRALSNTMAKAVKVDLVKGITAFKKKVSPQALMDAYGTKSYGAIMATIPWEQLPDHLEPATSGLSNALLKSGERTIDLLPAQAKSGLRWDVKNPAVRKYISERTGALIVGIQQDTMSVVHNSVMRSFTQALTPKDVALQIRDSIGLHPRYEQAVVNYRNSLYQKGIDPEKADDLADKYSDKLLDARALTVAKTETRNATNFGQLSVWKQGQNDGLLPRNTRKVWVTCKECVTKTPSPCDICLPMDGELADIQGFWTLDDGSVVETPSEAHPNCNCGMTIDFGGDKDEDKEDED